MFLTAIISVLLVAVVSSDRCSRHCSHTRHSVCGTDGKTYRNQCYLDIAICEASRNHDYVALAHNGSCGPLDRTDVHCDTLCDEEGQREYCGNDGKTYANLCELQNADCLAMKHHSHVTVAHYGACLMLNGTCDHYNATCPRTHDYKCGTTGYTYTNECYLKQAQCRQKAAGSSNPVTLLHDGKCGYASTNQSRNVDCTPYADMSLAGVAIEGISVKIDHCSTYRRDYVCANGISYSSECYLCYKAAQAHRISYSNLTIPIAHDGHCHYNPIIG